MKMIQLCSFTIISDTDIFKADQTERSQQELGWYEREGANAY